MRLQVKVTPSAPRDAIAGWLGDVLKVRVKAAPERGRANAALERLLADALGLGVDRVRVVAGHAASRKWIEVEGLSGDEVRARLEQALA